MENNLINGGVKMGHLDACNFAHKMTRETKIDDDNVKKLSRGVVFLLGRWDLSEFEVRQLNTYAIGE